MAVVDLEKCVYLHITQEGGNDNFMKKNCSCCILGGWVSGLGFYGQSTLFDSKKNIDIAFKTFPCFN